MGRRRRIVWRFFGAFLLVLLPSLVAVEWYAARTIRQHELEATRASLTARAWIFAELVMAGPGVDGAERLEELCRRAAGQTGARYTVVAPSGKVLGDSAERPERMEDHGSRPEIRKALGGGVGADLRQSRTVDRQTLYVAVPAKRDGRVVAAVRAALPLGAVEEALAGLRLRLLLFGLGVTLLAAFLSLYLARRLDRPIREMQRGAERFASGDLSFRLELPSGEETGALAAALNKMAAALGERLEQNERQREEIEAVLESMADAVLVLDPGGRIERLNRAAGAVFELDRSKVTGRDMAEVIRHVELQRFVESLLQGKEPPETDILLQRGGERHLRAYGSLLRDAKGKLRSALVVLHDLTRVEQLERIRRDFVANVSHELKTPITSIQGFVETLREGALEDPEAARRFLQIIEQQTERLGAIIEDLLSLARLEQAGRGKELQREPAQVITILEGAAQLCAGKARERGVRIEVSCPPELVASLNAPLVEQAIVNLLDNAIKYSPEGGVVELVAMSAGSGVVIMVKDSGCGIPRDHQERIFERFYRVDKARSRALGGTGLGLSIVKHIVAAHGGEVSVESTVGEGSRFTLRLPLAAGLVTSGEDGTRRRDEKQE
ncbi:MAG: ATP-binding protein [Polyangia bacterium]|jgi:two-component system phosphate regulon sensor histidine kinase PhoR|nr:ATP-binding protein [Polyangia bacterium]